MKQIIKLCLLVLTCFIIGSCGLRNKQKGNNITTPFSNQVKVTEDTFNIPDSLEKDTLFNLNLSQDLSKKTLSELRLLRNCVYARHGFCFMEADIREYFTSNTKWYDTLMNNTYNRNEDKDLNSWVTISTKEKTFIDKITALEEKYKKENFKDATGRGLANYSNIVNLFQYQNFSDDFINKLKKNNFVIVPGANIQLFQNYEENDYSDVPNFITTDLYLQLFHMYFAYLLKSIETHKLIPIANKFSQGMYNECAHISSTSTNPKLKKVADYCSVFSAIPCYLLKGEKKKIPEGYKNDYNNEIAHINNAKDDNSDFLGFPIIKFPYSLFKPRGNYTRNEELKKYFRAMMWLQVAPFCREDNNQLTNALFLAYILKTGKTSNKEELIKVYNNLFEPISFIIGEPDNLSILDLVNFLKKEDVNSADEAISDKTVEKANKYLLQLVASKNRIVPKIKKSCADKINFIPQRYLVDNEILQELVDVRINANRAYPKGLDVFAVFGSKKAEDILLNEYKESKNWEDYVPNLRKLQKKFSNYDNWNKSVYNKWLSCLVSLTEKDKNYPSFMQTVEWDKKNLNTVLASWAELKHDAILYAEIPMASECGGAGPPDPITVGYVEPNIKFWDKIIELIDLTDGVLKRNNLYTDDILSKTKSIREQAEFLLSASKKELNKEKLSDNEYGTIEILGASTEYLTLSIFSPDSVLNGWYDVKGPDHSVAIVADVYTRNVTNCDKDGILHVATGKVNDIYVVIEIEGYLYLTKGATFSFFEFVRPLNSRLTDEEWQEVLENKATPALPVWMKDIMFLDPKKPKVDEEVFYSSGC